MDLGKLAAWAVAALLAVVAATRLFGGPAAADAPPVRLDGASEPTESSLPGEAGRGGQGQPGISGEPGSGLHVHVAGAVRRPGVYRVPPGSRVVAAVDAAGGLGRRADAAGVNLAAPLQDGQQVVVPQRGRGSTATSGGASAGAGAGTAAAAPGSGKVSLSSATAQELETLDGIGPALAARIIEYRDSHGGFRSIEELQEVDGIGEKRFAALRDAVQP